MTTLVSAFASPRRPHYARHIAPILAALPPEFRGRLHRGGAGLAKQGGPLLLAAHSDIAHVPPTRPIILVEHGAGQSYVGVAHGAYAGGRGRDRVGLFLCPNQTVADRNTAAYPGAEVAVVGCPALDVHAGLGPPPTPPLVVLTFHFDTAVGGAPPEMRPAFGHYEAGLPDVVAGLRARGYTVVGHGHPRWGGAARFWDRVGIPFAPDWDVLLSRLSVLVVDNSSVGFEAAAVGRGLVWLNAPWYRRDAEHGLRFWSHVGVGVEAGGPSEVVAAVGAALTPRSATASALAASVFGPIGGASERAAAAIVEWVGTGHLAPR